MWGGGGGWGGQGLYNLLVLTILTFRVLLATYVAMSHPIPVCYWQHISPYLVLSLCSACSFISLNFMGLFSRDMDFDTAFDDVTQWEWGWDCCCFQFVYRTFCEVWTMFLLKNWQFYGQFGRKYDRACICDGIVYHFINFRKVWTLECVLITRYQQVIQL